MTALADRIVFVMIFFYVSRFKVLGRLSGSRRRRRKILHCSNNEICKSGKFKITVIIQKMRGSVAQLIKIKTLSSISLMTFKVSRFAMQTV